ncbi:MAG: prohibitin family protein [Clostridia bacterium]|nr:prohibitin family protein [Clostridia bacterium]
MAKSSGSKFKFSIIIIAVLVILAGIVITSAVAIVPAGCSGVVLTFGKASDNVMSEGLNFKVPFMQEVVIISNKIQKQEVEAAAVSKDLQTVSSNIAVNYRVLGSSSASIYKNIGRDYETIILLPAVQESMKSVSAKYTAEELITLRAQVGEEIKSTLVEKVEEYGIHVEKFNIVNFDFSEEFNDAIEAKQVAEQNLIKTKTEQEQALVIAEAQAEVIRKKAQAQADANKLLSESLTPEVVEYEKIQKWDGKLPYATGTNAFIDVTGLADNTAAE